MRRSVDCRLRAPKVVNTNISAIVPNAVNDFLDDDFYFGKANKPSTPIKKVVNSDYGNAAELD